MDLATQGFSFRHPRHADAFAGRFLASSVELPTGSPEHA